MDKTKVLNCLNKILELAGIVMNDPTLAQLSAQNVATEDQLQKV